jgi:cytochrome c oxidase subunit 2
VSRASLWLPPQGSTIAEAVDWSWSLVFWISAFFLALVTALLLLFVWRYRGREPQESASHNTPLEVTWTVIPTILVGIMFWTGYTTYLDMAVPPDGAYEIRVTGQKWRWLFTYPNGYVDPELHVPVDTPVVLTMTSEDVIHSLFIPAFRVKRDVIPGRYTTLWFEALYAGEFDVYCTEYCGTSHWEMLSRLVVHPPGEYEAWLAEASDFLARMPPAEAGQKLYEQRGCQQCHSLDGSTRIGPTFLGLYGSQEALAGGGSVTVDDSYIRESILTPQAAITAGFQPVMPSYRGRLSDAEIEAIIEFLKMHGSAGGPG